MTYERAQRYLEYCTENPGNVSPERWRAILIHFGYRPDETAQGDSDVETGKR